MCTSTVRPRSLDPFHIDSYISYKIGQDFLGRQYVKIDIWLKLTNKDYGYTFL